MSTVYALATAVGKAGVAVIRVSGPSAHEACRILAGDLPPERYAALRTIRNRENAVLDTALVSVFSQPGSFTGEDVVEFHLHGSIAVVDAVLAELSRMDDLSLAEPGEFTRRALLNGKMDLTQVEGLSDLIEAQTEVQRQQAQASFSGALTEMVDTVRERLIRAVSLLEAVIDFADEEVPEDVSEEVEDMLTAVVSILEVEISGYKVAERIRNGFEVAIVGAPNVGKSTLLNALAGRDVAITSSHAGTTRDVIEVQMNLGGIPMTLLDTAGIRETEDPVEQVGVERALLRAEAADLRVFLVEGDGVIPVGWQEGDLVYTSKADTRPNKERAVSGTSGFGIEQLIGDLTQALSVMVKEAGLVAHRRQAEALSDGLDKLCSGLSVLSHGSDHYEIVAEEVRTCLRRLDKVVGRVDVDDYLDVIFSSFCLGK